MSSRRCFLNSMAMIPAYTDFGNVDNLIEYLLKNQEGYGVSTIEAWDLLPEVANFNLAIETGYRHAYITVFNPPIHGKNIIIEWAGVKTDENLQKRVQSKFQPNVPGIVILGLIAADNRLKSTGNYSLDKYIPWTNDCHTYSLHVQQKMNQILPEKFSQQIISLPTHVSPEQPLDPRVRIKNEESIQIDSRNIRLERHVDIPSQTQLSHILRFFSEKGKGKPNRDKPNIINSSTSLLDNKKNK